MMLTKLFGSGRMRMEGVLPCHAHLSSFMAKGLTPVRPIMCSYPVVSVSEKCLQTSSCNLTFSKSYPQEIALVQKLGTLTMPVDQSSVSNHSSSLPFLFGMSRFHQTVRVFSLLPKTLSAAFSTRLMTPMFAVGAQVHNLRQEFLCILNKFLPHAPNQPIMRGLWL